MRIDIDRGTVEICGKKICWRETSKVVYRKLEQFIVWETHSGSYYQMQIEPDLMGGFPSSNFLKGVAVCRTIIGELRLWN